MSEKAYEVNFDGIVGPSHNYAGLALGNKASEANKASISNPKEAALQGLEKMKALHDMGLKQAVLPPHERPNIPALKHKGYAGSDAEILEKVYKEDPKLLCAVSSSSNMWTANASTVSPSADTKDGKVHITIANLASQYHRSIEPPTTLNIFRAIFANDNKFVVHPPLGGGDKFGDEGAANHTRFCNSYGEPGLEFFVFGKYAFESSANSLLPKKYPARQSFVASEEVANQHKLDPSRLVFAQQSPEAIDKGVFHNDVISVGNANAFLYHEESFVDTEKTIAELQEKYKALTNNELHLIKVTSDQVPVEDAVSSYLFNSQIISLPDSPSEMMIVAPQESQENEKVKACLDSIVKADNPIKEVKYFNVRQSMRNGGGPACLRLRVVLTEGELQAINQSVLMSDALYADLKSWINKHYRDEITLESLADPKLLEESRAALDELTKILNLGSIYEFQA